MHRRVKVRAGQPDGGAGRGDPGDGHHCGARRSHGPPAQELAEFRRNRLIVTTAAVLPVIFLVAPTASILTVKASALSAGLAKGIDRSLFLPLLVPVFVPAIMSAYSVAGEREQGTLEPVLTTPVGRAELLIGKAAAIFMPAAALGYLIFGVFVAITQLAASPAVAAAGDRCSSSSSTAYR
jgi:ABC-type transport system involved in multi-copper enzyme maturation permease subunit